MTCTWIRDLVGRNYLLGAISGVTEDGTVRPLHKCPPAIALPAVLTPPVSLPHRFGRHAATPRPSRSAIFLGSVPSLRVLRWRYVAPASSRCICMKT